MYGKKLSGNTSLVLGPIEAFLLLLILAFERLNDIKFVIIGCIYMLFKGNDQQGKCESII